MSSLSFGFNFRPAGGKQINGTSYQGHFVMPYQELVDRIGEPHVLDSGDGKVQAEWYFQAAGHVFTIYDWKARVPLADVHDWHVGGKSARVRDLVALALDTEVLA